jgi:5-methylcytosine-specific restriction endonuclease McrA
VSILTSNTFTARAIQRFGVRDHQPIHPALHEANPLILLINHEDEVQRFLLAMGDKQSNEMAMNFWWCNQGGPGWEGEREAGIVCAEGYPIQYPAGLTFRKTVGEVKAVDIILHYRTQVKGIVAFSRAREDGRYEKKLPKVAGKSYGSGWWFPAEYHNLTTPINKSDFVAELIPLFETGFAVNPNGNVKQQYFPRFNRAGLGVVLKHVSEPIPNWLSTLRLPDDSPPRKTRNDTQPREKFDSELAARIKEARSLSKSERERKMAAEPEFPKRRLVVTTEFHRSALVILTVLDRAKGVCEECGKKAPFRRRSNGLPYLEVHHRTPLSQGGKDKVSNAVALCPNCHRAAHHG